MEELEGRTAPVLVGHSLSSAVAPLVAVARPVKRLVYLFRAPYPLERPPALPSVFLYTREDEIFDDHWSRWIARALLGVEPIELPGGHFPTLEHPRRLADALERAGSY